MLGIVGPDMVARAVASAPLEWAIAVWRAGLLENKGQRKKRAETLSRAWRRQAVKNSDKEEAVEKCGWPSRRDESNFEAGGVGAPSQAFLQGCGR